jgi:hypothetical protein
MMLVATSLQAYSQISSGGGGMPVASVITNAKDMAPSLGLIVSSMKLKKR